MIIGVYDYDFMNYSHAVPNLECAKYCAYLKQHNNIAILMSELDVDKYTKIIIRKDYEDDKYDEKFFRKNVVYGGHAFSKDLYKSIDLDVESTIPNFKIYTKYFSNFGLHDQDKKIFKTLLNAHHFRLSLDNTTIWKDFEKQIQLDNDRHVLFVHDKNLATLPDAENILLELTTRNQINNPQRYIGTKFPIIVENEKDFQRWFNIAPNFFSFFLQYNGLMNNETIIELVEKYPRLAKSFYYSPLKSFTSEEIFYTEQLPFLYKQVLFLRRQNIKVSLIFDALDPSIDQVTKNLIRFLNSFCKCDTIDEYSRRSLFAYAKNYNNNADYFHYLTMEEVREVFQKVRKMNYEVFDMFYQWDRVKFQGGKFINDTQ